MPNPGKILGHAWDKMRDTLKVQVRENDVSQLTKRAILSRLGRIYDPLGVISPTTVEGKRIYRDTCEGERSWNADVPQGLPNSGIIGRSSCEMLRYREA